MLHFLNVQQRAFFLQQRNDDVVRFEDVHAIQRRISARQISAVRANRVSGFQAVFLTDHIVVRAVARRGVNGTGTGIQGNVIAEDCRNVEAHKRMGKAQQLKLRTFYRAENGVIGHADTLHYAFNQIFRQNHGLTVDLHQRIVEIRCNRDCAVRRQSPRRSGPDHQRDWAVNVAYGKFCFQCILIDRLESNVDGRRSFVVILNFRFRQRRTAVNAPVYRLRAFVQVTVADDFAQRADDIGFSFEVHGQVRVGPVTQHAQTDKVFALTVNLGRSVFAALGAELSGGEFLTRLTVFLLYFQLDRQTVAVPARHIRRVITGKPFGLHDNVFQNLVNRVTNMNAAIRIRRAIMQNEGFFAFFSRTDDAVQIIISPTRQHSRFALGEIATHREPCFRQIQG